MSLYLYIVFGLIALFRVTVLLISKNNEKKLILLGGKEYGKLVSKLLAILHTLFYFCSFFEGIYKKVELDIYSVIGIIIITFSFIILIRVIQVLGENWTVKFIIVDEQSLNSSWLFKYIKHPNYFLNIIPELIGLTMFFHSWITIMFFFLPYGICLYMRITEEDKLLAELK